MAQNIANKKHNFVGHKFWARGYYVSTVGADEKAVRAYIQNQESEDKRLDELSRLTGSGNPNRFERFLIKPPALLEVIGSKTSFPGLGAQHQKIYN